jgi:hypothetical protein
MSPRYPVNWCAPEPEWTLWRIQNCTPFRDSYPSPHINNSNRSQFDLNNKLCGHRELKDYRTVKCSTASDDGHAWPKRYMKRWTKWCQSTAFEAALKTLFCMEVRIYIQYIDRLYDLVVTVPAYRSRGPGLIPGATRFSEK